MMRVPGTRSGPVLGIVYLYIDKPFLPACQAAGYIHPDGAAFTDPSGRNSRHVGLWLRLEFAFFDRPTYLVAPGVTAAASGLRKMKRVASNRRLPHARPTPILQPRQEPEQHLAGRFSSLRIQRGHANPTRRFSEVQGLLRALRSTARSPTRMTRRSARVMAV